MRIVIDTNVVASAIFSGGRPAALLRMVITRTLSAVATDEIVGGAVAKPNVSQQPLFFAAFL